MNLSNFISRVAGEPVELQLQTVPTIQSFHQVEPTFFRLPACLTGHVERAADGVVIRAEVIVRSIDPERDRGRQTDRIYVPAHNIIHGGELMKFESTDDEPGREATPDAEMADVDPPEPEEPFTNDDRVFGPEEV